MVEFSTAPGGPSAVDRVGPLVGAPQSGLSIVA